MFRITAQTRGNEIVLKVEGYLAQAWVPELAAYWRQIAARVPPAAIHVDVTEVCHVDANGLALMAQMYRAGTRFIAAGCVMPELVREIAEGIASRPRS